ncbi:MAG: tryptophan synthase subunit alpha [Proteobacteria bacterium]|nr:tryptophan synthase subunit alpha [Pseudomonadota bacterium]
MSRFNQLFSKLKSENRIARIPFLMLGDPTPTASLTIINSVISQGIDALELGIPFSDPIADGPIIQMAANRARKHNATPAICFEIIQKIRQQHPTLPIGVLVYANLVYHQGISSFYQQAQAAGVDAVLIPDVPTEEASVFCQAAKAHGIHPVLLATIACSDQDLKQLAVQSEGFTYVVTRAGVTGTGKASEFEMAQHIVKRLEKYGAPPAVFGFGIKYAQDIKLAHQHGACGAIIGSALIEALNHLDEQSLQSTQAVGAVVRKLFYENVN